MTTHLFSETQQNEIIRIAAENRGFISDDIEKCKTFVANTSKIDNVYNWESMLLSTAQGGSYCTGGANYYNGSFDGRYVYFSPFGSKTCLRFDTTQTFQTAAAWGAMSLSTAIGNSSPSLAPSCEGFDGRYIYYWAYGCNTFMRYDTTLAFTNAAAWEKMNRSTAQGNSEATNTGYQGGGFDGRYMYVTPAYAYTFMRFDTSLAFTNAAAWERINMSTVVGANVLYATTTAPAFDGRYMYFAAYNMDTFLRFDTSQSFTNSSAWEKISMSTAQGAALLDTAYRGVVFDGRYIHFAPEYADTFLRFDTSQSFTNSSAWEKMSGSTALGVDAIVDYFFSSVAFDGRYIYHSPGSSDYFIKFDTSLSFTNSSAWEKMSMTTAMTNTDLAYRGIVFDGRYIYYTAYNHAYFARVRAMNSNIGRR